VGCQSLKGGKEKKDGKMGKGSSQMPRLCCPKKREKRLKKENAGGEGSNLACELGSRRGKGGVEKRGKGKKRQPRRRKRRRRRSRREKKKKEEKAPIPTLHYLGDCFLGAEFGKEKR